MSHLDWKDKRCIFCLENKILTLEHVIPESIGGILTCKFLCRDCNSRFGAGFEAKARLAPELRQAASQAGEALSELRERLERGAAYRQEFGDLAGESKVRGDGALASIKLADDSVIVSERDAPAQITSVLKKRDIPADCIARAIFDWQNASGHTSVDLGHGVLVRKWKDHPATPTYGEPELSPLVPLKISFEFAALIVGTSIYQTNKRLDQIRRALVEQDEVFAKQVVIPKIADRPQPFYGIAFEGNKPAAQFQVRLFGLLAYIVKFPGIGIVQNRYSYTHNIETGEDWTRKF